MHDECAAATPLIERMRADSWARREDTNGMSQAGHTPEALFLPLFTPHLGNALVTGIAREMLDTHVRIAQNHIRHVVAQDAPSAEDWMSERTRTTSSEHRGRRLWHTVRRDRSPTPRGSRLAERSARAGLAA